MPWPPETVTVEVTGRFLKQDSTPQQGEIVFINRTVLVAVPSQASLVPTRIEATLDVDGDVTAELLATDNPDFIPQGSVWEVHERWATGGGRTYRIDVPVAAAGSGIDLATVSPVPKNLPEPTAFVNLAALAEKADLEDLEALDARVDVLEGAGGFPHVHDQTTPSASWNVVHNRGRAPLTSVFVDNAEVIADVEVVDPNTVHIVFPTAKAGTAILH